MSRCLVIYIYIYIHYAYIYVGQKKVVLFPEIDRVNFFLSPTCPHKPNVYENIYFLFQKNTHRNKKFSTSKFIRKNLRFFPSNKKSVVRVVFLSVNFI